MARRHWCGAEHSLLLHACLCLFKTFGECHPPGAFVVVVLTTTSCWRLAGVQRLVNVAAVLAIVCTATAEQYTLVFDVSGWNAMNYPI